MESNKEYKLEEYSGELYTADEFVDKYISYTDSGVLAACWNSLRTVETEGLDLQELRRKLKAIYCKGVDVQPGDIIKENLSDRNVLYVTKTWGKLIVIGDLREGKGKEWTSSYYRLANIRGTQIEYNMVMNNLLQK